MNSEPQYRTLEAGEIIQEGDECDACANPWHDDAKWVPARNIGQPAPDPAYPGHTIYRRRIASDQTHEAKCRASLTKCLTLVRDMLYNGEL